MDMANGKQTLLSQKPLLVRSSCETDRPCPWLRFAQFLQLAERGYRPKSSLWRPTETLVANIVL